MSDLGQRAELVVYLSDSGAVAASTAVMHLQDRRVQDGYR